MSQHWLNMAPANRTGPTLLQYTKNLVIPKAKQKKLRTGKRKTIWANNDSTRKCTNGSPFFWCLFVCAFQSLWIQIGLSGTECTKQRQQQALDLQSFFTQALVILHLEANKSSFIIRSPKSIGRLAFRPSCNGTNFFSSINIHWFNLYSLGSTQSKKKGNSFSECYLFCFSLSFAIIFCFFYSIILKDSVLCAIV